MTLNMPNTHVPIPNVQDDFDEEVNFTNREL